MLFYKLGYKSSQYMGVWSVVQVITSQCVMGTLWIVNHDVGLFVQMTVQYPWPIAIQTKVWNRYIGVPIWLFCVQNILKTTTYTVVYKVAMKSCIHNEHPLKSSRQFFCFVLFSLVRVCLQSYLPWDLHLHWLFASL